MEEKKFSALVNEILEKQEKISLDYPELLEISVNLCAEMQRAQAEGKVLKALLEAAAYQVVVKVIIDMEYDFGDGEELTDECCECDGCFCGCHGMDINEILKDESGWRMCYSCPQELF